MRQIIVASGRGVRRGYMHQIVVTSVFVTGDYRPGGTLTLRRVPTARVTASSMSPNKAGDQKKRVPLVLSPLSSWISAPHVLLSSMLSQHHPPMPAHEDDDDNDICPVCDGDCTCAPQYLPPPSLKIKLTVPQRMLRHPAIENEDGGGPSTLPQHQQPHPQPPAARRRGRPPKSVTPSSSSIKRKSIFLKQKNPPPKIRLTKDKQAAAAAAAAISRKVAATAKKQKRKRPRRNATDHRSTGTSTFGDDNDEDEDDGASGHFPTFVSASALSSLSSTDSESSSSEDDFEIDSEIEAEEENFIIADVRDKARVRRELLGDDSQKKRDQHNDWVIRPRKKSVGPSEDEMDVDSDATDEEDEDEEDDDEEDEEEPDGKGVGRGYVGLATGWSEDDESSFDADLFFANLSGSDGSTTSAEDDADPSDMDSVVSAAVTDLLPHLRQGLENLPFEVTEGWDGQIIFTNGIRDGQGVLDIDFEIDAAQYMVNSGSSPASGDDNSDVEMHMFLSDDVDDRGYEEDADGGDGDTTDEELVGEDDLPNERAMRLFSFPPSVSAINPLSTVSPAVSPSPSCLHSTRMRTRARSQTQTSISTTGTRVSLASPKPADILAGGTFWESDDDDNDDGPDDVDDAGKSSSAGGGPRKGSFIPNTETHNAIIDDFHNGVPSPHPSFRRNNRGKSGRPFPVCPLALPLSIADVTLSSPVADRSSPFIPVSSEGNNYGAGSSIPPSDMVPTDTFDISAAKPIELNDVLEPSFLDPDPTESSTSTGAGPSVSAQAMEQPSVSWWRTPTNVTDYGKVVRPSPFSALLASRPVSGGVGSSPPLAGARRKSSSSKKKKRANRVMEISPVILPRDGGDRTPTTSSPSGMHMGLGGSGGSGSGSQHKSRKELRRERKLKRKMGTMLPHQYGYHHQYHHAHHHYAHHHYHRHYPNAKTRGVAGVQKSGGYAVSSTVPPLNL